MFGFEGSCGAEPDPSKELLTRVSFWDRDGSYWCYRVPTWGLSILVKCRQSSQLSQLHWVFWLFLELVFAGITNLSITPFFSATLLGKNCLVVFVFWSQMKFVEDVNSNLTWLFVIIEENHPIFFFPALKLMLIKNGIWLTSWNICLEGLNW